jgi:iron complex transport system substrate-binding protein
MRNNCRAPALLLLLLLLFVSAPTAHAAPEIAELFYESTLELRFAECFDVHFYQGGYALIDVQDSARYLVVPEGAQTPDGIETDIIVLQQPLDAIYLAATSAMALFDALGAVDAIRLSGTQASGWYIESAVEALNDGRMLFAGKYSQPDYEMLIGEDCDLAIQSTMILHTPKVQEMIELLGIPVFIDRSSYESHPLGRTEWIKLYAVLVGKIPQAEAFFATQEAIIEELQGYPNTEQTVAFFYVSTDGSVNVRRASDYVPRMIEIAGGRYAFPTLGTELDTQRSTVSLTMEEFYATAVNSDYLIYNASIDQPLSSIDELIDKSMLFADFKAVREGNVWCTGKYLYQATDIVGSLITDINRMLAGEDEGMTFLYKID